MTLGLLVNPHSGLGNTRALIDPIADELRTSGHDVSVMVSSSARQSAALAATAAQEGLTALVVLGGDGLAHWAIQGLAQTNTPLGIIPAGTGNDLAGTLDYPEDPMTAAAALAGAIAHNRTRTIDLARTGKRWWATVACVGLDSRVAHRANGMSWPRGPRRYDVAIALELLRFRPTTVELHMDDQHWRGPVTLVAIGNGPRYGGGHYICPDADLSDGLLEVTVVDPVSRLEMLRVKPRLQAGDVAGLPFVQRWRAQSVIVAVHGGVDLPPVIADGEALDGLPVTSVCVPNALQVLAHTK